MASFKNYQFISFAIVAIVLPTLALAATEYAVGDKQGWKTGVNYTEWAKGKKFYVGDSLVFKYNANNDSVSSVSKDEFANCTASAKLWKSGNDSIQLAQSGKKWYISGVHEHCINGQKFMINVEDMIMPPAPTPNSPSTNDSYKLFSSWFQIFIAAVVAIGVIAI